MTPELLIQILDDDDWPSVPDQATILDALTSHMSILEDVEAGAKAAKTKDAARAVLDDASETTARFHKTVLPRELFESFLTSSLQVATDFELNETRDALPMTSILVAGPLGLASLTSVLPPEFGRADASRDRAGILSAALFRDGQAAPRVLGVPVGAVLVMPTFHRTQDKEGVEVEGSRFEAVTAMGARFDWMAWLAHRRVHRHDPVGDQPQGVCFRVDDPEWSLREVRPPKDSGMLMAALMTAAVGFASGPDTSPRDAIKKLEGRMPVDPKAFQRLAKDGPAEGPSQN